MTQVNIDIEGISALAKQLQSISSDSDDVLAVVVADLAADTEAEAKLAISAGGKTGVVYKRRGVSHRSSSRGQAPASDTGVLLGSIQHDIQSPLLAYVGTRIIYGRHLEFGTTKMAARPWLLPSFEKAKIGVSKDLKREIERLLKNA